MKENLIILSSIFMSGDQTSLRMKNKYGTIHYNLKSKTIPILIFPNMLHSSLPFPLLLQQALEKGEQAIPLEENCTPEAYANSTLLQTLQMLRVLRLAQSQRVTPEKSQFVLGMI